MTLLKRVIAGFTVFLLLNFAWADVEAPKTPPEKNLIQMSNPVVTEKLVLAPIKPRKSIFQNEIRANSCTGTECCCVAGSYGTCYDRVKCGTDIGKCGEAPGC